MIELNSKKGWVFDLDGTLTIAVHDFAHMRRELGMPDGADILATIAALPLLERQQQIIKLDQLEAMYAAKARAAKGVLELIPYLAQQGSKLGIFTRNTKAMAQLSLQAIGLEKYFDADFIIGRDDAPHKPDPQGLHRLLNTWQLRADQAVMIGDFKYDLEAGRAAGVATVHVATDQRRWPQLTDYCFASLLDVFQPLSLINTAATVHHC